MAKINAWNVLSSIRNFILCPEEHKVDFKDENTKINLMRIRGASLLLIALSTCVGLYLFYYRSLHKVLPTPHALLMHVIMIFAACVFLAISNLLRKDGRALMRFGPVVDKVFGLYLLAWGIAFSLFAQATTGQITVYIMAIISVATLLYLDPRTMAGIFLAMNLIFVSILPAFQVSPNLLASHRINSFCLIAISEFFSALLYQNRMKDHIQKTVIDRQFKELIELNGKLEDQSSKDGLTGINNRRAFDGILLQEWKRAVREAEWLTVGMIDIDFFKAYNDEYGHLAGDDCIKAIVNTVSGLLRRPLDSVSRFGGEEFIVLLPDTDSIGAATHTEKMRAAVEALGLPHAGSPFFHVTVSIGVHSMVPKPNDSPQKFLECVDRHLYQAKRTGKNRVAFEMNEEASS